jgi:hypothetical protein
MDTPQAENLGRAIVAIQPRQIGALPLVYPILDALHVCSSMNALVPSQADVDLGCVVLLLVLNRLLSPRPLYQVQDWMRETVLPELWGVPPEQAHDNRLGAHWTGSIRTGVNCGCSWSAKRYAPVTWT